MYRLATLMALVQIALFPLSHCGGKTWPASQASNKNRSLTFCSEMAICTRASYAASPNQRSIDLAAARTSEKPTKVDNKKFVKQVG
jgi:hypothetical protein